MQRNMFARKRGLAILKFLCVVFSEELDDGGTKGALALLNKQRTKYHLEDNHMKIDKLLAEEGRSLVCGENETYGYSGFDFFRLL